MASLCSGITFVSIHSSTDIIHSSIDIILNVILNVILCKPMSICALKGEKECIMGVPGGLPLAARPPSLIPEEPLYIMCNRH